MIAFLKGILAGKSPDTAFIEVNGVGFAVGMSQASLAKLPEAGQPVQVHTHLQMREDGASLYGFLSLEEQALFEQLIGVSGVGPKVALAALSSFSSPQALASAISAQDVAAVQRIPGVGKKTASRIILELKGSLDHGLDQLFGADGQPAAASPAAGSAQQEAREALLSMGFTSAEVDLSLKGAPEGASDEALLKYALKRLGSAS
ncbi:MAG: Holliday junction branch migration protein RuvA [Eggerthellaceae bacterium]|nr:Holliday junction branch migration protein RuvA [Eggerthellaceae bacterium]